MKSTKPGDWVEVTSMARIAVGQVKEELRDGRWRVRLYGWQADGYHLDVGARVEELAKAKRPAGARGGR